MKPLLLGMNNPLSDDPEYDLYPYPEGSAGWRLWKMLPEGTSRVQYLAAFDRLNLLRARTWSAAAAREAGQALLPKLDGRTVVVLGSEVRAALGLPKAEPLAQIKSDFPSMGESALLGKIGGKYAGRISFEWIAFPHPSGRNRWFNQPENRRAAEEKLAALFVHKGLR